MTFTSLAAAGATYSNYTLTIAAGVVPGVKTFNVIYTNKLGVVTTVPISFTVIWRPVDGPNYYPVNSNGEIETIDTYAVTCVLSNVVACISSNYLRVIKFTFLGSGCTEIVKNYNGSDSVCNTSSAKTEHAITSEVTHFKGCRRSSSSNYIGGFMIKMAA
jgi:hypothetical protein